MRLTEHSVMDAGSLEIMDRGGGWTKRRMLLGLPGVKMKGRQDPNLTSNGRKGLELVGLPEGIKSFLCWQMQKACFTTSCIYLIAPIELGHFDLTSSISFDTCLTTLPTS